tara:strand:+ start:11203 stop:11703 length:501 start_codon:yes stop_codon:yes gene_type:complete
MNKGTIIQLTREERDLAYSIGLERYEANRNAGVDPNLISGVDEIRMDQEGVSGEIALSKGLGQLDQDMEKIKDTSLKSVLLGTDEGDVIYKGLILDVKTTKYKNGHLLIKKHKLKAQVDGYALITGWYGRYTFAGYIEKDEVEKVGRLEKNVYWIKQEALKNLPTY